MSTPRDADARRYYRVAYQRLDDGSLMLEKLGRAKAAIYLAGYAAECILKALILARSPRNRRSETLKLFRGAIAHDLSWLRSVAIERGCNIPGAVAKELAYVASWSVELRYEPGDGNHEDAQRFLSAIRAITSWADGSM